MAGGMVEEIAGDEEVAEELAGDGKMAEEMQQRKALKQMS
jgi:hypothetical protein